MFFNVLRCFVAIGPTFSPVFCPTVQCRTKLHHLCGAVIAGDIHGTEWVNDSKSMLLKEIFLPFEQREHFAKMASHQLT